nr:sulfite exporter TauE/SafE family protein [Pseudoruegeria sp. HB172150]
MALAAVVGVLAGFVKGAVGFALPMIMISGLGSFLPPELALAALIVPTVVANIWQSMRDGLAAALESVRRFWVYTAITLVFIATSAQLVRVMPGWVFYLILGVPVTAFALAQLLGWRLVIRAEHRRRAEVMIASLAGFIGGLSGVWGPPTVAYLTALETPKAEQMRVQGVIYGAGSVVLLLSHLRSGVLNGQTLPLSVAMLVPCMIGLVIGYLAHDRMDQERFRRMTLAVLVVAGLNLVRRGLAGI